MHHRELTTSMQYTEPSNFKLSLQPHGRDADVQLGSCLTQSGTHLCQQFSNVYTTDTQQRWHMHYSALQSIGGTPQCHSQRCDIKVPRMTMVHRYEPGRTGERQTRELKGCVYEYN